MRRIGEVAAATGLTVRTLHHYDEIGLLAASGRSDSGYRLYSDADVRRLYRIVAFRRLGFALGDIGPLLDRDGGDPRTVVRDQLAPSTPSSSSRRACAVAWSACSRRSRAPAAPRRTCSSTRSKG
jgi:DNA-binding transcriptional MerR regulator